jgi:hypothetical protein
MFFATRDYYFFNHRCAQINTDVAFICVHPFISRKSGQVVVE